MQFLLGTAISTLFSVLFCLFLVRHVVYFILYCKFPTLLLIWIQMQVVLLVKIYNYV
jgi:hypothetical protein